MGSARGTCLRWASPLRRAIKKPDSSKALLPLLLLLLCLVSRTPAVLAPHQSSDRHPERRGGGGGDTECGIVFVSARPGQSNAEQHSVEHRAKGLPLASHPAHIFHRQFLWKGGMCRKIDPAWARGKRDGADPSPPQTLLSFLYASSVIFLLFSFPGVSPTPAPVVGFGRSEPVSRLRACLL